MNERKGILLTDEFDLAVQPVRNASGKIVRGVLVGNTIDQDAVMVLKLHQGNLKEDPLLGVGLTKYIRGKLDISQIESRIRVHFTRAGLDYDDYKERIKLEVK